MELFILVSAAHCLKKSTEYEVIFSLNSIQSFQQCVQSSGDKQMDLPYYMTFDGYNGSITA